MGLGIGLADPDGRYEHLGPDRYRYRLSRRWSDCSRARRCTRPDDRCRTLGYRVRRASSGLRQAATGLAGGPDSVRSAGHPAEKMGAGEEVNRTRTMIT